MASYNIPKDITNNLSDQEREVLFEALIFARNLNGVTSKGHFSNAQLTSIIQKMFPENMK